MLITFSILYCFPSLQTFQPSLFVMVVTDKSIYCQNHFDDHLTLLHKIVCTSLSDGDE